MDLILLLILSLTSLSSFPNSVVANKSTKKPLTTPTILKTLTTTKPSTETGSSILLDTISTTTPLPKPINSSKSTNETKVNRSTKSDETGEILNGQEQAQSPYIRGRDRQNGFQPTLGPNYNPNYGLPFNAFIPQGLPFSGSQGPANNGLNNRPGLFNARDQLNNNNNINNHNRQGQLTSPLDLLSGFIPTPGPGGPYTGTPTPFGQPVTGYPGYPNYPGLNPNYGPVNAPGLNNNGFGAARGTPNIYNQLGRPDAPETGLGAQGDNTDGQEGEDGADQGGVDGNSSNEDEGQEENGAENGAENESGQPDNTGANDTEETGAQDDQGGEGGEGETGAGGGQGGEGGEGGDPSNDPDLAQFQNFQGGNFPGDLFPPGILSQQDLKDIQKSMDEQQKKEAEKKRQEEEGASAQPDYDYDDGTGKNNGEETSTETPANLNPNYNQPINQPVVPNYQNRLSHHQGLNNNHGAYANNNQLNHQINNQYNNRLNPGLISNQRKSNPQNIQNYQQNQFDDNVGYNNPNNIRPVAGNQDYDYNGSGESGINQGPVRSKGDNNRYNNYKNGAYSSGETNDYDNNNGNNDQYGNGRTQSYPRGSNFNRFNQDSGRYRPGTFGQSGYRGENLRDFGGHSADSYQQNDVEPGVDYSPDPVYDSKRLRKQDKPRRLSVPNNRPINNGRNINRFSGIKPSVDYDGETRNYPGSTRKPSSFKVNAPTSVESSIQKPLIPSNHNPFIANHKWSPRSSEYDTSSVDYDEGEDNTNGIGYTNLPKKPLNYDSSKADYTNDVDQLKEDNNSGQLTNYRQTPRFNASEKKEDKRLANSQIKTIDPFLRG